MTALIVMIQYGDIRCCLTTAIRLVLPSPDQGCIGWPFYCSAMNEIVSAVDLQLISILKRLQST